MRPPDRRDADHRRKKLRVARNDGGRQPALAHQFSRTIDVFENSLEQLGALDEPGLSTPATRAGAISRRDVAGTARAAPRPQGPRRPE